MKDIEFVKVSSNSELIQVERLANKIWRQYYIEIIGLAQVEYMLREFQSKRAIELQIKDGFLYYLMKLGANFIGYLGLVPEKKTRELFISKFYIKSGFRNKGYGKKGLEFILQVARKRKLKKITLMVSKKNLNSIITYKKMGFRKIDSVVKDIGAGFVMDDYRMEKRLK